MDMKFSSRTLPFLIEAGQQIDPNWLEQNQTTYEAHVRAPFIDLAERLKAALQPSVPDYHFPCKGIGRIKRATHHVLSGARNCVTSSPRRGWTRSACGYRLTARSTASECAAGGGRRWPVELQIAFGGGH